MLKEIIHDTTSGESKVNIENSNYYVPDTILFYDSYAFHSYHQVFTDEVWRVHLQYEGKPLGLVYIGFKSRRAYSPYSAPFSMIYMKDNCTIKDTLLFFKSLKSFFNLNNICSYRVTLPPSSYNEDYINLMTSAMVSSGFIVEFIDLTHNFHLEGLIDITAYKEGLSRSKKNYFNQSIRNKLSFEQINIDDAKIAYDIIKLNREVKNYPLKMTFEHIKSIYESKDDTVRFFILRKDDTIVASAIVFDVTNDISQVVYWGDVPEYTHLHPMTYLPYKLIEFYRNSGKKILDIGPSSERGVINQGLADFKKSIGSSISIKISLLCTL
jgi:predicted N-acyltransferase